MVVGRQRAMLRSRSEKELRPTRFRSTGMTTTAVVAATPNPMAPRVNRKVVP